MELLPTEVSIGEVPVDGGISLNPQSSYASETFQPTSSANLKGQARNRTRNLDANQTSQRQTTGPNPRHI